MRKLSGARIHFVGIGGIGMCGLAELMHNLGAVVTGSDMSENQQTIYLKNLGLQVYKGHEQSQVGDVDVVVYSSAVKPDNVELLVAKKEKIPIMPRAEALAEIMRLKRGVAIAGTHGKTTTTSLCASAFLNTGVDPTIVVGGRLDLIKSTAKLGQGEWLVAEADESDGSFQKLSPEIVVITNIDDDHLDHYGKFENLQNAFYQFALKVPFYGTAIVCGDDEVTFRLFNDFPKKMYTYGLAARNDFVLKRVNGECEILFQGATIATFVPPMPGNHNALNCTAAIVAGYVAGLKISDLIGGVESFGGVDRRFQLKGNFNKAMIFDDYAHHPTEIQAVLQAFKEKYPEKKINAIFQPHRYSRFKNCWQGFLSSFDLVDELYVLPVYKAGEEPLPDVNSENFCRNIDHPKCQHKLDNREVINDLKAKLSENDILVTLGAGDVWKIGVELCSLGS